MARNTYNIDEKLESPFNAKHLLRSLHYAKKYLFKLILCLLLSVVTTTATLFVPYLTMLVIDDIIPNANMTKLFIVAAVYLVIIAGTYVINYFHSKLLSTISNAIVFDIRQDLFAHIQELPFSYFDNRPHGKIHVRVVNYVQNVANFLSSGLLNIIVQVFSLIAVLIFMFTTNVLLSLVIIAGVPVFFTITFFMRKRQRKVRLDLNNKSSNLTAYLAESIDGIKTTQTFDRQEKNSSIFHELSIKLRSAWIKTVMTNLVIPATSEVIATTVWALVYGVGALALTDFSLGIVIAMAAYANRFWGPIQNFSNIYNQFMDAAGYLERIFETMDEPVDICDIEGAKELPEIKGDVEFKNVTFAYEEGKNVLENLSFKVKAGESVALVGPTGAGKSTIVNLLSRFYDIDSGEILIDGHNIHDVTMKSLRSQMGVMLQDTFIFSGDINENIRYGRLDATQDEIVAAAKAVRADDFISKRPEGYFTTVSERGNSLSAGQRQLVSFARTMLSDPKILILDEATSSIDTETEVLLQKGIQGLLKGRTSFIIAHRLSTIKSCDKIFYISDKGIKEAGSHDELMAKKGYYYNLCMSQQREME